MTVNAFDGLENSNQKNFKEIINLLFKYIYLLSTLTDSREAGVTVDESVLDGVYSWL